MAFLDWWVPNSSFQPGETERLSLLANQSVSAWRAVGGKLVATDRRLVFYPNRVDRKLGGRIWTVPLTSITSVGRKPPTGGLFNGGLRSRLTITTSDGVEHLFVVNKLADVVKQIEDLARSPVS